MQTLFLAVLFFIDSNASVFVSRNASMAYSGDITNNGWYQSFGTEIFNGTGDQSITGNFSDTSFFGNIQKENIGDIFISNKTTCARFDFQSDGIVSISDTLLVDSTITGYSPYRFFDVGNQSGFLKRTIIDTALWYAFPMGNDYGYQQIDFNMKSLGQTGFATMTGTLQNGQPGTISVDTNYSGACNPYVFFDCLGTHTWNFHGPIDYDYTVRTYGNPCGRNTSRVLSAEPGTYNWNSSLQNVVGDVAENFCKYSDWSGIADTIPGGMYHGITADFAVAVGVGQPLPVTLIDFRADPMNNQFIRVSWQTLLETNNDRFVILRSTDAVSFESVGEVLGYGNTTTVQNYHFDDRGVQPDILYYYQLKQYDYDGQYKLSKIVSAKINGDEILETKYFNILGQEITEAATGMVITRITRRSGTETVKQIR